MLGNTDKAGHLGRSNRPLRGVSYGVHGVGQSGAESMKAGKGDDYAG